MRRKKHGRKTETRSERMQRTLRSSFEPTIDSRDEISGEIPDTNEFHPENIYIFDQTVIEQDEPRPPLYNKKPIKTDAELAKLSRPLRELTLHTAYGIETIQILKDEVVKSSEISGIQTFEAIRDGIRRWDNDGLELSARKEQE